MLMLILATIISNEKHVAGQSGNGSRNNTYNFHSEYTEQLGLLERTCPESKADYIQIHHQFIANGIRYHQLLVAITAPCGQC